MSKRRPLGIFVNPYYFQEEGVEAVVDRLRKSGATALVTHPHVAVPSVGNGEQSGDRFPPLHVDGWDRVLSRPLWDKREQNLETYLAYEPNPELYKNGGYRPSKKNLPPDLSGEVISKAIRYAHDQGMAIYLHLGLMTSPDLRPEDMPICVDGRRPERRVSPHACLNSPSARAYGLAILRDILDHFPEIDGLFVDWAEYAVYFLEENFTCFCSHCVNEAQAAGIDFERMRSDVTTVWEELHHMTPDSLAYSRNVVRNPLRMARLLAHYPGISDWLRFKAGSVASFYREVREAISERGRKYRIGARTWAPPWNIMSGSDYELLAESCDMISPKIFSFDYCAMPRWYGEQLKQWNNALSEQDILDAVTEWIDLPDDVSDRSFQKYRIPGPDVIHPARIESHAHRLTEIAEQVAGKSSVQPFMHAYVPDAQWQEVLEMVAASSVDGIWVQMYGYLSDSKLQILKDTWS